MGEKVFYGKGIRRIKNEDPELYGSIENLDKNVWNANVLDYRTQKLIAIAISATANESSSFLKQVSKAKKELDISRDEMMDVLKVVLLTSGMIPFNKALEVVNKLYDQIIFNFYSSFFIFLILNFLGFLFIFSFF